MGKVLSLSISLMSLPIASGLCSAVLPSRGCYYLTPVHINFRFICSNTGDTYNYNSVFSVVIALLHIRVTAYCPFAAQPSTPLTLCLNSVYFLEFKAYFLFLNGSRQLYFPSFYILWVLILEQTQMLNFILTFL